MSTVLCVSSLVVRGSVGAAAARIALEHMGHEVWVLPSVILSNHRGHGACAGPDISPDDLRAMLDALEENGWLGEVDAVLTGYLPSEPHVGVAFDAIGRVRALNADAPVLCDPACGDAPKGLYIEEAAARAMHDWLLPVADIATPNAFELAWLTGESAMSPSEARAAAHRLGPGCVLVTSVGGRDGRLVNLLVQGDRAWIACVPARRRAPHGTGDFMAARLLGHWLNGKPPSKAMACATAEVEAALAWSGDGDELKLVAGLAEWTAAAPWPIEAIGGKT